MVATLTPVQNPATGTRVDVLGAGFSTKSWVSLVLGGMGTTTKVGVRKDGTFSVGVPIPATLADGTHILEARKSGTTTVLASVNIILKRAITPPPPTLAYSMIPLPGAILVGSVPWLVNVTVGVPTKVDMLIDGVVHWPELSAPWGGTLDTKQLSNGPHTLSAIAYDANGAGPTVSAAVTINNVASPTFSINGFGANVTGGA